MPDLFFQELLINNKVFFLDGAMGTMIQRQGLPTDVLSESLNLTHAADITAIHKMYVDAGADAVTANTFQANPFKIPDPALLEQTIIAGIDNAKKSGAKYIALDIGPSGHLMEPIGDISFEAAYDNYKLIATIGEKAGADFAILETMSDLYELKAAVLAVTENTKLPVIASMTYSETGKTFMGCDPVTATITLNSLGAHAIGANCSFGPRELMPVARDILKYSEVPVILQANAGMPKKVDGKLVYDITDAQYAEVIAHIVGDGVRIIGGCCGTTPDYIRAVRAKLDAQTLPQAPKIAAPPAFTSATNTAFYSDKLNIASFDQQEFADLIADDDYDSIADLAIDFEDDGCDAILLDTTNIADDEVSVAPKLVMKTQAMAKLPLVIAVNDPEALRLALRVSNGRACAKVSGENFEAKLKVALESGALVMVDSQDLEKATAFAKVNGYKTESLVLF